MAVQNLPVADHRSPLRLASDDGVTGGRVYDIHIAEIARAARVRVIVTDNRRHVLAAVRHGLRVESPRAAENRGQILFLAGREVQETRSDPDTGAPRPAPLPL